MKKGFYVTDLGRNKLLEASNEINKKVNIVKVKIGDAGNQDIEDFDYSITSLVNSVYEKTFDENDFYKIDEERPNQVMICCYIPKEVNIDTDINEIGFYDEEDDLIVYGLVQPTPKRDNYAIEFDNWIEFNNKDIDNVTIVIDDRGLESFKREVMNILNSYGDTIHVERITEEEIIEITGTDLEIKNITVIGDAMSSDDVLLFLDDDPDNDPIYGEKEDGAMSTDEILNILNS